MKQEFHEVLLYLFEQVFAEPGPRPLLPDQKAVAFTLQAAGFAPDEVNQAVSWLQVLLDCEIGIVAKKPRPLGLGSMRVYDPAELAKLGVSGISLLVLLEDAGLLDMESREAIINTAMAIEDIERLSLEQLRYIIVPVVFNKEGKQTLLTWIDRLDAQVRAKLH
jgi:Smg protein